jgi:hypothetical protein
MKALEQPRYQNLSDYNASRLVSTDMLSGKEYRRLRRKNKKYKNIK